LEADFQRARNLPRTAFSREDFDRVAGDQAEAKANVQVAKAQERYAKQQLDYTTIRAQITGRVSRRFVDEGNFIKDKDTMLTTIVSLDKLYGYFDVDEGTLLKHDADGQSLLEKLRRLQEELHNKGASGSVAAIHIPIHMNIGNEKDFKREGEIDFVDNRMVASTGTLRLRGVFPNPKRTLAAGLFARFKIEVGSPHQAVLMTDRALATDQGQKYLYVVGADNKVQYRSVKTGGLHPVKVDGKPLWLREIKAGLKPGERVVVQGMQRLRPQVTVHPIPVTLPVLLAEDKSKK
jgi:RND family efflux transporter MFP subunit